ncbi:MAG TPA: hypothetical protein VN858_09375 [Casimicrobiaceae bacterium]|nr:hypothetical protein [Casimicrobiaceae bacterium]
MRGAARCAFVALLLPLFAHATPIPREQLVSLCADAEDQAQCGRLVEKRQLRAVARFVERDGDELRVQLSPFGLSVFHDSVNPTGATTYAVWDYLQNLDTLVLFTTRGERTGFLLVERRGGEETRVPSEPIVAPDERHFVTADFCERTCDNEVALWRVARDGIHKEATWTPPAAWSDVSATWHGANAIALEYTAGDESQRQTVERHLDDRSWKKVRAK